MNSYAHLTDEEAINNVDMDMEAGVREKDLAMRLALRVDTQDEMQERIDALQRQVDEMALERAKETA